MEHRGGGERGSRDGPLVAAQRITALLPVGYRLEHLPPITEVRQRSRVVPLLQRSLENFRGVEL